jgi:cell division protein FtsL
MIRPHWQRLPKRQRVLLLIAAVLVVLSLLSLVDVNLHDLPLPNNVRDQERQVKTLRRDLAALEKEELLRQRRIDKVRAQAKPLWQKSGKNPSVEVQTELEKVARGRVTLQTIGASRLNKLSDNVSSVELPVRIAGSMREIGRFLAELEKNEPAFFWSACTIKPDNPREPRGVMLDGRVQVLVLSADASKFLAAGSKGVAP